MVNDYVRMFTNDLFHVALGSMKKARLTLESSDKQLRSEYIIIHRREWCDKYYKYDVN